MLERVKALAAEATVEGSSGSWKIPEGICGAFAVEMRRIRAI